MPYSVVKGTKDIVTIEVSDKKYVPTRNFGSSLTKFKKDS